MVKIAIIDSGIDARVSDLGKYLVESSGYVLTEQGIVKVPAPAVSHAHGTALGLIIRQLTARVEFYSIKILDEKLRSDGRLLLHALEEALRLQPAIINLSLGTRRWRYRPALGRVVKKAVKQGTLIIAAASNTGARTYPAEIKNVIKVRADLFERPTDYTYRGKTFFAPCTLQQVTGSELLPAEGLGGNSMAAAYITGHAAALIDKNKTLKIKEIIEQLVKGKMNVNH